MNNPLVNFIAEFVLRLFSEKPKFFIVIQWISILTGGVAAVLSYLISTGSVLPSWIAGFSNVNVIVGSVVALILSQLTNKDKIVADKIEALHAN